MIVKSRLLKKGFSINLLKDSVIEYPAGIWRNLDKKTKQAIVDNLVYLKISPYAMFTGQLHFHSPPPRLRMLGDKCLAKDIPRIAEEDGISAKRLLKEFKNKKITFENDSTGMIREICTNDSALIGMSFGKDSLLSYGVAKELGLKPKLVMVQDFWDAEATHKLPLLKRFGKEFNEKIAIICDTIDNVSSSGRMNSRDSEGIVNANAMNAYMTMLLPLALHHKTRYIVFGNEQNFNDYFISKEGLRVYPSYDQSTEWMRQQNNALKEFTGNKVQVSSFIEPLYNIAEVKVLFNRYPKIAKYQMSCGLSAPRSGKERWCYKCPMCAKAFLYLKANSIDPKIAGFSRDMFGKKYEKFYPLFNKKPERIYEKPKAVRDEQLLAFYLAFRNKARGFLIDKFKDKFLKEAAAREDELYSRFFRIHNAASIPDKLKWEINSIYREELK